MIIFSYKVEIKFKSECLECLKCKWIKIRAIKIFLEYYFRIFHESLLKILYFLNILLWLHNWSNLQNIVYKIEI